jgi:hypothetical protein
VESTDLAAAIDEARGRPPAEDPYHRAALVWANQWRRRFGLPELDRLPAGSIDSAEENSLARAIGPGTRVERWWARLPYPDGHPGTVAIPEPVEAFLERFDFGLYPALVEPRLRLVPGGREHEPEPRASRAA